jgi:ABC-type uncharacterized transport system involved in gliding motility auxiliary subunit
MSRFLGVAGVVVFLFGIFGAFVFGLESPSLLLQSLVIGHLAVGAGMLLVWFLTSGLKGLSSSSEGRRSARFAGSALTYTAVVLVVLGLCNYLGYRHNKRWDLTEQGVYSLSPQSRQVVQGLKQPLSLIAFKADMTNEQQLKDLLSYYRDANKDQVSTEIIDPRVKPHLVDQYEMKQGNQIYIAYGTGDTKAVSRINEANEEAVTNAILKLARGQARKIYYVQGYGQPGLTDTTPAGLQSFADAVKDEHMEIAPTILAEKGKVPDDAAAVVLLAPKRPMLPAERDALVDYASNGGRLLLVSEPQGTDDVSQIASRFGIEVGKNLVVDLVARLFQAPALGADIVVQDFGSSPITRNLSPDAPVVLSLASSVKPVTADAEHTVLLKSSSGAWGETDLAGLFDRDNPHAAKDPQDLAGPVPLAVTYEKKVGSTPEGSGDTQTSFDKTSRVVVFGGGSFLQNGRLGYYANRDLILNTLSYLVGEEGGLTIRARSLRGSIAPISADAWQRIFILSLVLPELLLLAGLLVWWRRKTGESRPGGKV